jgi:hypothetical protein
MRQRGRATDFGFRTSATNGHSTSTPESLANDEVVIVAAGSPALMADLPGSLAPSSIALLPNRPLVMRAVRQFEWLLGSMF